MVAHVIVLTLVMLLAGVFGGLVNFYLLNQGNRDAAALPRCLVVGVGAAFLVPVVLDLVSSEIIQQSQEDASKMLIYTGICLIAAIASRLVVVNGSDRTLRAAESAKEQVEQLQHELKTLQEAMLPLIETETEQEQVQEVTVEQDELDVASTNVLKSLSSGRYIFRAAPGLSRETDLDETELHKTLGILAGRGLAGKVNGARGTRWYVTERGRKLSEAVI